MPIPKVISAVEQKRSGLRDYVFAMCAAGQVQVVTMELGVVENSSQGELLLQLWRHLSVNVTNLLPPLYSICCLQHTICTEAYGSYICIGLISQTLSIP